MNSYYRNDQGRGSSRHFKTLGEIQEAKQRNPDLEIPAYEIKKALKEEVEMLELNIRYYSYQMQLAEVLSKFQQWQGNMERVRKGEEQKGKKEQDVNPPTPEESVKSHLHVVKEEESNKEGNLDEVIPDV